MKELFQTIITLSEDLDVDHLSLIDRITQSGIEDYDEAFTFAIELCSDIFYLGPDWSMLAGRLAIYQHQKTCPKTFSGAMTEIRDVIDPVFYEFVMVNRDALNAMVVDEYDFKYNIKAFKVFLKTYAARRKENDEVIIVETPQYMWLRVATFLWMDRQSITGRVEYPDRPFHDHIRGEDSIESIRMMYHDMANFMFYTPATPTLFNAGMRNPQMASCFTKTVEDKMVGRGSITESWREKAIISCNGGGIGEDMSGVRGRGSTINNQGTSNGIVGWIEVNDKIASTCDQRGRRKGAFAMYLDVFHIDLLDFLDLKLNDGTTEGRARNLFYGLMMHDEFYRRVNIDGVWTLFCPKTAPDLVDSYGKKFDIAYRRYETMIENGEIVTGYRKCSARSILEKIISTQIETSLPYILNKDTINRKSNHQNLGSIRLSNLCCEITLFSDKDNIGTCNLSSVCLNNFIIDDMPSHSRVIEHGGKYYDFLLLELAVRRVVHNLNRVIDRTYYIDSIPQIEHFNMNNRPLGIGVQGLNDVFNIMDICWEDEMASTLNNMIFETIYFAAVSESCNLARRHGAYRNFYGSPMSKGFFQFDMWSRETMESEVDEIIDIDHTDVVTAIEKIKKCYEKPSNRYDWDNLRGDMMKYGVINSMLIALMPTASTSSLFDNTPSFEPRLGQMIVKTLIAGQVVDVNKHMMRDLKRIGIWTTTIVRQIIQEQGSLQGIPEEGTIDGVDYSQLGDVIRHMKRKYKTAYELPQRLLIDMSADRGRFVCQSQSLNCFFVEGEKMAKRLTKYQRYAFERRLKTCSYYVRQQTKILPFMHVLDSVVIPSDSDTDSNSLPATPMGVEQVCEFKPGCTSCGS